MTNWLCVITRENFDKLLDHKTWGVKEHYKSKWEESKVGDKIIFYIMREVSLAGIFEVSKAPFKEGKRIFVGNTYPFRMGVKDVFIPKKPIEFSPKLRNKLEFIKNKKNWVGHIRRAMNRIPEKDFQLLEKEMKGSSKL